MLANRRRLQVLRHVLESGRTSVTQTATACKLPLQQASVNLRGLQSRGLLAVERISRWTFYTPQADPSVRDADPLLRIMTAALRRKDEPDAMLEALTACTHPRRLLLLQALREGPLTPEQLGLRCHISQPAVYRHMRKLLRRGVVQQESEYQPYALAQPANRLLADLVALNNSPP
jgi:DNA-binding transcriptional ArsR family regulator